MKTDPTNSYPPEFSHLEDLVREARQQMDHMADGMANFPEKGVRTAFDKPKEGEWRFGKRTHLISVLEDARAAYYREIRDWVNEQVEMADLDPDTAHRIRFKASCDLGDLYIPTRTDQEKAASGRTSLIDKSSGNDDVLNLEPDEQALDIGTQQPDGSMQTDSSLPPTSMSARFSQSLGYTKYTEKTEETPAAPTGPNHDMDR